MIWIEGYRNTQWPIMKLANRGICFLPPLLLVLKIGYSQEFDKPRDTLSRLSTCPHVRQCVTSIEDVVETQDD
jgi:hypothetical protein